MPLTTRLERVHAQPLRWAGLGAALLLNLSVLPPAPVSYTHLTLPTKA